jgi:hypothetical protein
MDYLVVTLSAGKALIITISHCSSLTISTPCLENDWWALFREKGELGSRVNKSRVMASAKDDVSLLLDTDI